MTSLTNNAWHRACKVNTVICIVCSVLGTSFLIYGIARAGGVNANFIIYKGSCSKTRSMNLWLHLLLNIFSTVVLASTNFFMQILASPSRAEVNKAHLIGTYLSIGIPSIRNVRHISALRIWLWTLFWLTSLPFHFFFNSTVFSTKYVGSDWHLYVASEGFVNGAHHFGPGAVLWAPGAFTFGYGSQANITDYFDSRKAISREIQYAAGNGATWKRLEVPECLSQYVYCAGRETMRNVIWIVKSHNSSGDDSDFLGWKSTTLLNMGKLTQQELSGWSRNIPYEETNSLWFASKCSAHATFNGNFQLDGCWHSCNKATGSESWSAQAKSPDSSSFTYDFFAQFKEPDWPFHYEDYEKWHLSWPGIREGTLGLLDLQYCLAEERAEACKVGLCITLLSVIVICLWIKSVLCIGVLFSLCKAEPPLVVLGDAIASFVCSPDNLTVGRCTLDRSLAEPLWQPGNCSVSSERTPWKLPNQSWWSAISNGTWKLTCLFFALHIILVAVMLAIAQHLSPLRANKESLVEPLANSIIADQAISGSLIPCILVANCPQLLLSMFYFFYNAMFTRLCVEKEWKSHSLSYKPLRVTNPRGQQRSTYRLQLPYRYSIALICASITLHWVVSNVSYAFIYEGGYLTGYVSDQWPRPSTSGLEEDAFAFIGYSTLMLLILLLIIVTLVSVPFVLAMKKARGQTPNGGSNSKVISAACHVPVIDLSNPPDSGMRDISSSTTAFRPIIPTITVEQARRSVQDSETASFGALAPAYDISLPDQSTRRASLVQKHASRKRDEWLLNISQAPLRWGEVSGTLLRDEQGTQPHMHLSFGALEHNVQSPIDGKCYC